MSGFSRFINRGALGRTESRKFNFLSSPVMFFPGSILKTGSPSLRHRGLSGLWEHANALLPLTIPKLPPFKLLFVPAFRASLGHSFKSVRE